MRINFLFLFISSSHFVVTMSLSLRSKLLSGGKSYGPVMMSDSPVITELLAFAGYGHVVIDHEHSPTDSSTGQILLQALDAAHTSTQPIIRVPSHSASYLKKILDSMRLPGGGVLVPMVENAETAQQVVVSGCLYLHFLKKRINFRYLTTCQLLALYDLVRPRRDILLMELGDVHIRL